MLFHVQEPLALCLAKSRDKCNPRFTISVFDRLFSKPKRRHPKQKRNRVLHEVHKRYPGERLDYVTSRKRVYLPDYAERIANNTTPQSIAHSRLLDFLIVLEFT